MADKNWPSTLKLNGRVGVEVTLSDRWFIPTTVEGLILDIIWVCDRKHGKSLPLTDVPPRLFSEVMRDLDLVVSVAHQGGVDPEASASTVEMRAALVRETNRLKTEQRETARRLCSH
jgi:hypothetical protein